MISTSVCLKRASGVLTRVLKKGWCRSYWYFFPPIVICHFNQFASLQCPWLQVRSHSRSQWRGCLPLRSEDPVAWIHLHARSGKAGDKSLFSLRHHGQLKWGNTDKNKSTYKYLSARFYPVLFSNRTFLTAFRLVEGSVHRLCGITWRRFEQLAQK